MQHEYDSLMSPGTWELVDLPEGRAVVNNMWIGKIKFKSDVDGDVYRYKAGSVAKGCNQRAGLVYTDKFSLVSKMAGMRLFLTIYAAMSLEL
jgi:hypothetical protein